MNYDVNQFYLDIQDCLSLANKELCDRKNGILGESTIKQLENYIIPDLTDLRSKIERNDPLPPNTQQYRYVASFGNAFKVWNWDMAKPSELYLKLLRLNENYRKI